MARQQWADGGSLGATLQEMVHGHIAPVRGIDRVVDTNPPPRQPIPHWSVTPSRKVVDRETLKYLDMQQRARLLIPLYPVHSRLDDVERVRQDMVRQEEHSGTQALARQFIDRRREERRSMAWTLTRTPSVARQVAQELRRTSMAPLAPSEPLGNVTAPATLLSRHVDVNCLKKERSRSVKNLRQTRLLKQQDVVNSYDEMNNDIARFERACPWTVQTRDAAGNTAQDWTGTRRRSSLCTGALRRVDAPPSPDPCTSANMFHKASSSSVAHSPPPAAEVEAATATAAPPSPAPVSMVPGWGRGLRRVQEASEPPAPAIASSASAPALGASQALRRPPAATAAASHAMSAVVAGAAVSAPREVARAASQVQDATAKTVGNESEASDLTAKKIPSAGEDAEANGDVLRVSVSSSMVQTLKF